MPFSRADGTLAKDVPAYRRIMPFLMRGKNESAAYFEQEIAVERAQAFIEAWNERSPRKISFFHLYTWAVVQTLAARPRLNRFVAGARIYDRKGIWISYSAKKSMNDDSPVVVRKCRIEPGRPFAELVDQLHADVDEGRAAKRSHVDKELSLVLALPAFLLRLLLVLQGWLDAWNLLPQGLIRPDPLFASAFIANLGSLKLDAVHHHLYEYGNIPVFACIGRRHRAVVANDRGEVSTPLVCVVKYTYDERVEDGLYCVAALEYLRRLVEDPLGAGIELPAALRLPAPAEAPESEAASPARPPSGTAGKPAPAALVADGA